MHYTIFRLNRGRNGMKGNIFSWAGSSKNGGNRVQRKPCKCTHQELSDDVLFLMVSLSVHTEVHFCKLLLFVRKYFIHI